MRLRLAALMLLLCAPLLFAQSSPDTFAPMNWPTPNSCRTADGRPGPGYWQQRADYNIKVSLDTAANMVTGSETITYTNNSPNDLSHLWLQLDQDLFKEGSRGRDEYDSPSLRWWSRTEKGGDVLESVKVLRNGVAENVRYLVDDTRMIVYLPEPLPHDGGKLELNISWHFNIPTLGSDRMGKLQTEDGTIYQIAQWYPRMCVYDDVRGWNTLPYLGQGEFYLEYGDFKVSITVPRTFIVAATGVLQNPGEVLTKAERDGIEEARKTDRTVHIISAGQIGDPSLRPEGDGELTWIYEAKDVRDFSWAASRAFIWDASHWGNVLLMALYPKEGMATGESPHKPGWESVVQMMRHTFMYYSTHYYPYPYPVAVNVAGNVFGMEYPMIVFCSVRDRGQMLYQVSDHEFGHSWFPMTVGSNERRHAWMDEGLNTFLNYYSNRDFYGDSADQNRSMQAVVIAKQMLTSRNDQPIETPADQIPPQNTSFLEYSKAAFGLRLLRHFIIGRERFDPAFKAYIRRWAFKHPQPSDFFRTIDDYTGEDLSWFWRGWFYSTHVLDQAIDSVVADSNVTMIYMSNDSGLVMPTELKVTYANGDTSDIKLPVEIWFDGSSYSYPLYGNGKVVRVVLDPYHELPDVNRSNNTWTLTGSADK